MNKLAALLAASTLAALAAAAPATAGDIGQERGFERDDQASARAAMTAGRNLPIRQIERRIIPQMPQGDEYIGFEYDSTAQVYRLKFIRSGRMIWVDVDAQTARVLRVSG